MPVKHLQHYADIAAGKSTNAPTGGSPASMQKQVLKNPPATTYTRQVPEVPAVNDFGRQSLKPGGTPSQPPKDGGRAAHLNPTQPKVGTFKDAKHPVSGAELY